jgi:hypothetical protein
MSNHNPAQLWMRHSHLDADSWVGLGRAKFLLSESLILPLVEVFPPLKIMSHEYSLSSVPIKFQNCTGIEMLLVSHQISMNFQLKK